MSHAFYNSTYLVPPLHIKNYFCPFLSPTYFLNINQSFCLQRKKSEIVPKRRRIAVPRVGSLSSKCAATLLNKYIWRVFTSSHSANMQRKHYCIGANTCWGADADITRRQTVSATVSVGHKEQTRRWQHHPKHHKLHLINKICHKLNEVWPSL